MKRTIQNRSGFTLLEVLIATMISGIVLAAVMEVFASNYKSYILQDDIANMQENIRIGMTFLDRDVTMIGSGMPGVDGAGFWVMKFKDGNLSQERAYPLTFQNNAGALPSGTICGTLPGAGAGSSDRLIIRYNKFEKSPCGDKDRNDAGVLACDRLPQLTLVSSKSASSSEADVEEIIRYSNNCKQPYDIRSCACSDSKQGCYSLYPLWNESCYCGDTTYSASQPRFFALITSPDGSSSDIFVLTSVNAKDQLQNHPVFKLDNKVMNGYNAGSSISFFTMKTYREVMYYVQDNNLRRRVTTWPDPGNASLSPNCDDQPIAENIDDLQFAFGLDTDSDGELDTWINERNLTDNESTQVRMVRINLLGRTARANNTFYTSMRNTIRTATGTASDKLEDHDISDIEAKSPTKQKDRFFVRKLLQTTVKVRSLGL